MDAPLEAAILDVLERFGVAAAVDDAWLREHHPGHWREIRAFLDFEARVAGGSPRGTRVGPYRLLRRLGRGGAGTVYFASVESASRGLAPGACVSLKVLHPHLAERPGFAERTVAEARAAASIVHPNVARTFDADVLGGPGARVAYVATEFVDGQNLRGLLDDLGPLGEPLVRHLAAEILRALVAIHAAGLVHGDLKPENVLLGEDESVKLADIGASTPSAASPPGSPSAETRATPRSFRGTLLYAAPETIEPARGAVDGRADLYALGVMVEELLAGVHPFGGRASGPQSNQHSASRDEPHVDADDEGRAVRSRSRRAAETPTEFLRAFARTLRAERPEDRFATAADALAALEAGESSEWWHARCARRPPLAAPQDSWSRAGARSAALRGREIELDRLVTMLDAATAGRARSVVIAGEPGSGRTRLAEEICEVAAGRGAFVVWVSLGHAGDAGEALGAALRGAAAKDAARAETFRRSVEEAGRGRGADAAVAPSATDLGSSAGAILAAVAREMQVVLVADDFDTPGAGGAALVGRLADDLAESRALLVATRLAAEEAAHGASSGPAERIDVEPLGDEAVSAVVADVLGSDDLGDRLGPEIRRRTDGNPLAVLELLDELRASERIVRDEKGAWVLRGGLDALDGPMTARAILARRLASLSRADRDLLAVAACTGLRFDAPTVARALGIDTGRLLLRLARLERREHLVKAADGAFAFEHHQVREAVLADLAPERAREHHAALAGALEDTAKSCGRVSGRDAVSIARHAIAGADGPRAAGHLVPALAWLQHCGRSAEVVELATAALALEGAAAGRQRALVLAGRGLAHTTGAKTALASEDYAAAAHEASEAGDPSLALESRSLSLDGLVEAGRLDEAEARMREVLELCTRGPFPEAEAHAQNGLARVLRFQSRPDEAIVHARRVVDLRREMGDERDLGVALHLLACAISERGDHDEALRVNAEAIACLRRTGVDSQHLVWALTVDATCFGKLGRRSESFAAWERGAGAARAIGDLRTECVCLVSSADQVRMLGRWDEARRTVERALAVAERTGSGGHRFIAHQARALLLVAEGRTAETRDEAERCIELATDGGLPIHRTRAAGVLTGLHATWGDRTGALRRTEETVALAGETDSDTVLGFLGLIRGRWGRPDGRLDAAVLRDALRRLRACGAHDLAAIAVVDLARCAADEGRRDDAVRGFEEARALFLLHGVPGRVMECDTYLARLGAADPVPVARRLAETWPKLDMFLRIQAAGRLVAAGATPPLDAGVLERAREDATFAVAHAPPEHAARFRARLDALLVGREA